MATFKYIQLMTETERIRVGDEISFDDVLDYMGRIKAVANAGAKLAERNLLIDENFRVTEATSNPCPVTLPPSNS